MNCPTPTHVHIHAQGQEDVTPSGFYCPLPSFNLKAPRRHTQREAPEGAPGEGEAGGRGTGLPLHHVQEAHRARTQLHNKSTLIDSVGRGPGQWG